MARRRRRGDACEARRRQAQRGCVSARPRCAVERIHAASRSSTRQMYARADPISRRGRRRATWRKPVGMASAPTPSRRRAATGTGTAPHTEDGPIRSVGCFSASYISAVQGDQRECCAQSGLRLRRCEPCGAKYTNSITDLQQQCIIILYRVAP